MKKVTTFRIAKEVHRLLKLAKRGNESWDSFFKRILEEDKKKRLNKLK